MKDYLTAIISGLLLAFSFPKFNLEFLAWFAFVPLLFSIYKGNTRRAMKLGFVTGLVFYFITMSWVTNTLINYGNIPTVVSWLILTLLVAYMSLYLGLFAAVVNRFGKKHPVSIFLLAPVTWTALEYLRSTHSIYGFSWQGLGYSQFQSLPVIQMASITGVYGISALIVLVNAGLFILFHPDFEKYPVWRTYRRRIGASTLSLLLLCVGYGWWTLKREPVYSTPPVRVGLIQGNIPQKMKWDPAYRNDVMRRYRNLTLDAAVFKPDLMIWPEAVIPFYFGLDAAGTSYVVDTVRASKTPLLFGSPAIEYPNGPLMEEKEIPLSQFKFNDHSIPSTGKEGAPATEKEAVPAENETLTAEGEALPVEKEPSLTVMTRRILQPGETPLLYNSAYLVSAGGETQGRYDKIHLVPFGEFVPFRSILFFIDKLVVGIGDFQRGENAKLFEQGNHKFAVSICFEIIFPDRVRQPVREGANYLVNITNDAWFGESAASYQHMSMVALRAVENRVPIVRAANTGISGAIDSYGRIFEATEIFEEDWILAHIRPNHSTPGFYSTYGDVFSWICLGLFPILAFIGYSSRPPSSFGWA
jgi:apolipoprotein N-acyltransferase